MALSRRRFMVVGGTVVAAAGLVPEEAGATEEPAGIAPQGEWLAGETHAHDDHSADGSLPRQTSKQTLPGNLPLSDQIGEAERIGLDFLPLTDHRTYDQHWDPQWQSSKLLLIPGEEANGSPTPSCSARPTPSSTEPTHPAPRHSGTCNSPSGTPTPKTPP